MDPESAEFGLPFEGALGLRFESALLAVVAIAAVLAAWRVARAAYSFLFAPFMYVARAEHLRRGAATRSGRVIRNLPKGSAQGERPLPAFPNGWFYVEQSSAIGREQVRSVSMLGLELAVFRDASGLVHAVDAYCPHLGANLAVGGRVAGDCIECPFHGWRFRGADGRCQLIPGAKRVPDAAHTRSWRVIERNGAVLLWHHAEDREPDWFPPQLDDYQLHGFTQLCGRIDHVVYSHIQDVPENGADIAHFAFVHAPAITLGSDLARMSEAGGLGKWISSKLHHKWHVTLPWQALESPESHTTSVGLTQDAYFGNYRIPFSHVDIRFSQIGPGIVYIKLHSPDFCDLIVLHYVVPEEPFKQRLTHVMFSQPGMLRRLYGKTVLANECSMAERDVQIWNNKCARPRPVFAATEGDEVLRKFRRWYSQFYTYGEETSTKSESSRESLAW